RQVVTALAARDRLEACEEFLETVAWPEVLIVSGTRLAADELARRYCLKAGGSPGIHRFSLGTLAIELASPGRPASGQSIWEGVAVDALAARAVQECRTNAALRWFEPVATAPGFFRALAATLAELRQNNVGVELLSGVQPAGFDLSILLSAYGQYLSDAQL